MIDYRRYGWALLVMATLGMAGSQAASGAQATLPEAKLAVRDAELAVERAQAQRALWTSAEDALRKARAALNEGNATMAVEQAQIARKQVELGIAQKSYPLFHER